MTTTTKLYDSQSVATRLHLVEEKLKNVAPGDGGDLTAVIAGLNRLYELTMKGSVANSEDPITYTRPDSDFWLLNYDASIITRTYGAYGIVDFDLETKPFIQRVLEGDEQGVRTANRSLLQMLLGGTAWSFETSSQSLASKVFGTQSLHDEYIGSGSLLTWVRDALQAAAYERDDLQSQIDVLRNRLDARS
ncbi:hypothetical protein ASD54_08840 [Rhizobium sp. Root149]|uniref:hypothetical protein n=1 Tax=Rhizobium sp. Root149 TaxID=1736473 RepID=UPI000712C393|nr:hypothetical protein [Rhizobium sp. Root149]KQZ50350.1 hypothetical protein ASD54_08840 [Rhizobium sp. Root149]